MFCGWPTRSTSVMLHDAEEAVNRVGFTEEAFPDLRHCKWEKRANLPWLDVSMRMLSKLHRERSAKVMEIETKTMLAVKVVVLFWKFSSLNNLDEAAVAVFQECTMMG